jgi:hypothetical protein
MVAAVPITTIGRFVAAAGLSTGGYITACVMRRHRCSYFEKVKHRLAFGLKMCLSKLTLLFIGVHENFLDLLKYRRYDEKK